MTKGLVGLETAAQKAAKPKEVQVRLHGAANLNAAPDGRGLAVVSRVYFLRDASAFQQLPREAFESAERVADALKQDIVGVKEQVVIPGKQYDVKETVGPEVKHVGVVALFRSTKTLRWRVALPVADLDLEEKKPLVVGLHGCVITVADGLKNKDLLNTLSLVGTGGCH